ncbi:MAG TPA: TIGR04282 family arsenosugar biosynthesis glycosyltransferase [Sphingomicrobium sp.]|nr:TIGR04282 family arsenosugar biosynthesis glycosyltransferase [Sphingomicrobium sp.]
MTATRIVIFAKAPVAGSVKTRLIPLLGAEGAAQLAATMLQATVAHAIDAGLGTPELCASPDHGDPAWKDLLPENLQLTDQGPGDLGKRLATAALRVTGTGERLLLIGTDCPALDGNHLRTAASQLDTYDAVLFPAEDGGYVLLGLNRFDPTLFHGIAWSTDGVAKETMKRIATLGWTLFVGPTLRDIDEPNDLDPA